MSGARHGGQHGGPHIGADDLALYALQVLEAEEAAAIAEHLRGCAECRGEVAALRGDLAALAVTTELQAPPAKAKQRLFQQIAREKKVAASPQVAAMTAAQASPLAASRVAEPAGFGEQAVRREAGAPVAPAGENGVSPLEAAFEAAPDTYPGEERKAAREEDEFRRRRRVPGALRALPWLGWAVAAGMAGVAGDLFYQRQQMQLNLAAENGRMADLAAEAARGEALMEALTDRAAVRVSLQTPAQSLAQTAAQGLGQSHRPARPPEPTGRAIYVPDKGTLLFTASNLEPLPQDKTYELWLIPGDGRDPIPAGLFQPDARGNASVVLPQLPKGVAAKAFGVTIEEVGGAEKPTLPILLAGAAG
jgi:anti-sigma-K factor RskA